MYHFSFVVAGILISNPLADSATEKSESPKLVYS
jgi:hypothetical protein